MLRNFPNLKDKLIELRSENKSFYEIARYFNSLGYRCDRKTVSRVSNRLLLSTNRRNYSGVNNPFFNKTHTDKAKEMIGTSASIRCTGKGNYFYGRSGELSPNWKGGISSKKAIFYASADWKSKRFSIFARDKFTCKLCGHAANKYHGSLNVHHIVSLGKDFNMRLDDDNLITLCVSCHKATFGKESDMESMFQDIVRTSGRPDDGSRNVYHQQ